MNHVPDQRDRELLSYLQDNARMTISEIGSLVGLSPSGIQKRMRKLEEKGVIKKYATIVYRSCFGYDMLVFIQVTIIPDQFNCGYLFFKVVVFENNIL